MINLRAICFALLAMTLMQSPASGVVTDAQVGQTIKRMKRFFYQRQDPVTGAWEFRTKHGAHHVMQAGGETALVTLAMLISGESGQNPKLVRALQYLQEAQFQGTYAVAVRAHVWSHLPPEYMRFLEADTGWLLEVADKHELGLFDYTPELATERTRIDHSITQYGMLGLWQAAQRGLHVPQRHWERWVEHFIDSQHEDGGWAYGADEKDWATGSMTTAGLTALYVGQQELHRTRRSPEPKITAAINKGRLWLDQRYAGITNPNARTGENNYYFLYGIERVALVSGLRYLNGQDWFQSGAAHIIRAEEGHGSIRNNFIDTAFSLMFLARGRYPVWINKLKVPGAAWNNHPNDLYFFSRYLSDQREGEVNWQIVSLDSPPDDWLTAPVAYLASSEPISLTTQQQQSLKHYLDMGGLLVTSPDHGSSTFSKSIRQLAKDMYPQYTVKRMPTDHAMFRSWHRLTNTGNQRVFSLSNGARELMIMADRDWGFAFQADKEPGKSIAWKIGTNIFAYATDKGVLNNRLISPYDMKAKRPPTGQMTVGRARYEGNWLPEPAAWVPLSNYIFNRTGLDISTTAPDDDRALDLSEIGPSDLKLIHLTGTGVVELGPSQLTAIKQYVQRGGTILVETVGGHGDFSRSVERQLVDLFDNRAVPLTEGDPIISGSGLPNGYDSRRALYRRYAVLTLNLDPKPHFSAFLNEQDRPMVILSHEDLSLGMLGCRHWDIMGYQPKSARQIMTNIVQWAYTQKLADVDSPGAGAQETASP